MVRVEERSDGWVEILGRRKNERMVVSHWPCGEQTIRKLATKDMPAAWVDEVAEFAEAEWLASL